MSMLKSARKFYLYLLLMSGLAFAANDLVVTGLSINPASPSPGQTVTATVTIKNNGPNSTPFGEMFRTGVYLDGTYKSGFYFLVMEGSPLEPIDRWHIKANESFTDSVTFTWPSGTGGHTVLAQVDDQSVIAETNESNNTRSLTISPANPDLVVLDIWTVPASPTQGQSTQWFARIQNIGSSSAASSRTGLYVAGSLIGDVIHGVIPAGSTAEGSVSWTPASSGNLSFFAAADRLGEIAETNESNNGRTETVTVGTQAQYPDLFVQDVWTVPASPTQGQSVQWYARVQNLGSANAASGSRTGLYINGSFIGDIIHGSIAAGASAEGSVAWTPSTSGSFSFQATADRLSAIAESNETNNSRTETVTVNPPAPQPDLYVQDIWTVPASPVQGQSVQVFARTQNSGSANAASSRTGLYVNGSFLGDIVHGTISGGGSAEGSVNWTPSSSGTFSLQATADRLGAVGESNETNNSRTENVTVNAPSPQPDLIVQSVWITPANPQPGTTVTAYATIKNQGSVRTPVGQEFFTNFYLDGTYKSQFLFFVMEGSPLEPIERYHLQAGESFTGSANFTWPNTGSSHTLIGYVDFEAVIAESNEGNNSNYVVVESKPDLIVEDVWTSPATPTAGQSTQWFARVKNVGAATAPASVAGIFVNDVLQGNINVSSLALNGTQDVSVTWTPPNAGSYSLRAEADRTGLVNEAIEVNNSRTETVNVVAAPPDLVVTNLSISPASPTPGSTVTVTVGIQNTGSGNTPNGASIRTGIYLDSSLKNSFVFSNGSRTYMLAGETFSASRTFTWPNAGSYTLRAVVDDLNAVSESNETNNERTQAVGTIGPDLLVEDVWSSPSSPEQSYPVTWFARVRNTGNAPVPSGAVTGVYVAGSLRGDFNIGGLAVGATMTGSVNWTPTTNGTVSFSATADRLGVITELNESNNTRSETITILTPQPKPDLVVTSIYLNPAFPTAGQTVQATINIQNTGSVATPLDIEVETGLFVDSETSPRTSFIFLVWEGTPQEPIERLRMHAGETFSDTVSFIWPNDANAHTVRAKIDYPAQIVESNENNNEYSISVSQAPDLSVQDIWINPDPTIVSQVTQVSARVRNLGNVNAPASNTRFTLGGQTLNAATPAIAVGQTADVSVSWTPSTAGSIAVQAVADSANAIAEQNESNNARTENFTVNALPNVDLVVSSMILTPQYPTAGQTVNASITIQNVGTVSSQADGEIFTGLFLDNESNPRGQFLFLVIEGPPGEPIDRTRIHPGETYSDTISFVWPNDANAHSVKAWVDYPGTIVETDNNNNTLIRNVLSAPDLLVQDIVLNPDPTTVGLSTQLTAVVRNAGNLTAPAGTILRFNAGGQVLDVTTPAISPNQSVNVATSWTPVTAGTNSLSATADATGILTEQSENNNSRTESTNVNNVPNVDLVISAFNVSPASPNAGSTVTAYITVKNQGSVATPHETEIETALYLDGASTLTTSFIVEFIEGNPGEPISRFHLRAGESFYGSVTFTWPAGNSHSLLAKVDAPETISEIVENNNTATLNVSQPDLVLSDLVINPSAPQAGNSVQIGATITNQGAVSSGTPLRVEAKINGVSLQVLSLEQNGSPINLGPGQSHTFTFTTAWVPPSSGAYAVELKADPTNTVAESNEQNNTLTQNVTVGQNTGPDLVVSDLIFSPNAPLVGEGVQIEARIENIGLSSATGPIALRLSIDGSPSALETIQDSNGNPISLAAGATTSHHFVVIWSVPDANPHSFTVLVDPNQTIPESNESNNERSETLTATANIVDLVMTDIRTVPETLTVGNPVQVYATLKNRGDLATPAGVLIEVGLAINGTASGVFQVLQPDGVTPKSLAPGESFEGLISPNWMPTQGGTFSLLVTADLNQAVTEYDETNNQFSRTVEVENDLPPISGIISPANLNSGWNAEDPLPEVFDATLQSALAKSYGPEPFVLQPAQSPRGSHTQIWGIGKSVISDTDLQGSIPTHVYAVFEWSLDATKKFRNSKHNIFVVPFPDHLRGTQSPFRYDQRQRAVIQTAKSWTQTGENVFYQTEGDNFAAFVFVPQSELEKGGVASVPNQATAISHNIVMSDLLQTTDANNNRLLNISYLDANGNQSVLTAQFFDRLGRGNGAHRIGSHAPTSADFNKMGVNHEGLLDALGRPTKSPSGLFISDTFSAQSGVGRYTKFAIGKSRTSVFQESQSFWSNSSNYTATGFGPNGNENHQYIQMLGNDGQNSYVETVYEPDSRGRVVAVLPAGELGHQIGSLRYSRTHYTIIPAPTLFFDNVNDLPAELRQARMNHVWRGQAPGGQVQALIFARIAVNPDGLVNAFFEQEEDSPASLIVNNVSPDVLQNWGLEIRYLNQAPSTIQDLKSSIIYLPFNNLQEHTAFINKNNGNSINIVTYQQYDRFNRLRAKYPPLALNLQSSSNGWSVELVPSNARYASLYSYNNKDQLIQVVEPDSGITKYKYNRRGQIRFSQNSMLAARGYWFETISDSQDRVVQTRIIQASEASIDNYVEQTPGAVSVVSESTSQFIFDAYSPDQEVLPFGPVIWPTVENLLEKYPFQSSISFGTPIGKLTQTNDAYSSERQYFDELGRVVCRVMIQKDLSEPQIFWAKYRRFDGAVEQTYYENADAAYGYEFDNWERLVRIWDLKPVSRRFNIFVGHKTSLNSTYFSSYAAIGPLVDEASGLNAFEPPIKWAEYQYGPTGEVAVAQYGDSQKSGGSYGQAVLGKFVTDVRGQSLKTQIVYQGQNVYQSEYDYFGQNNLQPPVTNYSGYITKTREQYVSQIAYSEIQNEYEYDGLGQIILAKSEFIQSGGNRLSQYQYQYDRNGNRTYEKRNNPLLPTGFDGRQFEYFHQLVPNHNRIASVSQNVQGVNSSYINFENGNSSLYDEIGNVIGFQTVESSGVTKTIRLHYDDYRNPTLPTQITSCSQCDIDGNPINSSSDPYFSDANFRYNAKGQRISRHEYFYQNGQINNLGETNSQYLPVESEVLAQWQDGRKLVRANVFAGSNRIGYKAKNQTAIYVKDQIGTTKATLNLFRQGLENALIQMAGDYDPFGITRRELFSNQGQEEPFGFNGQEKEASFGLQYFGNRYYFPEIGRFISVDPLRQFDNSYCFVGNNPLSFVDPDGMQAVPIGVIYIVRGTIDGKRVTYVGQTAQELQARISKHKWKEFIMARTTQVHTVTVSAELNISESGRQSMLSARREALGSVEERIRREVAAEPGKNLNEIRAATPENEAVWGSRHKVEYTAPKLSIRGGVRLFGLLGPDLWDAFMMARDQKIARYVQAPYVFLDEGGYFTVADEKKGWFDWHAYKIYFSGPKSGSQIEINEEEFDDFKREGQLLYGGTDIWGDFYPGLLRTELYDPNIQ